MTGRYSRVNLHKFIEPEEDADRNSGNIFKSHAYSKAAKSGGNPGGLSLSQRREIARNRRLIGEYRRSQVGGLQNRIVPSGPDQSASPSSDNASSDGVVGNRPKGGMVTDRTANQGQEEKAALERQQHIIAPPPRRSFGGPS